jgi:phosphatidylserine decarboxylase
VRTSSPLWLRALRHLPRNALSRLAGRAAGAKLPPPVVRAQIALFARAVGVDLSEMRDPIETYASVQAFFTRALKDGARPVDPAPEALVSPCDGAWGECGVVRDGLLLQLKGRPYGLAELLGSAEDAARFEGGPFATLYLSPRDYHRFHAPCDARVERATYIPGSLWPVNRAGLEGIEALFAQNERICAFLRTLPGDALLCLVAVGATMVGKVRVTFDALETNRRGAVALRRSYDDVRLAKGEEWGRFEFGSTLVLLGEPGRVALEPRPAGAPLCLGERIGRL